MRKAAAPVFTLALLITLCPGVSPAATLRVPEEHGSIQEAVNAAKVGDTVLVSDGEYRENVSVRSGVVLKSVNGHKKTVVKAYDETLPVFSLTEVSAATLEGFTAKGSEAAGITLRNASKNSIINNSALSNGSGITLFGSAENSVTANSFDFNSNYGIYLEKSNKNTFADNSADYNGDKGIYLNTSNLNTFLRNSANINTWNGIVLMASHYNEMRENKALRNTYGIAADSDDNVLVDNTTWPNFFIILPIILIYIGIMYYLLQKFALRFIYKE